MSYGVAGAGAGKYGPNQVAGAGYCAPVVGGAFTSVGSILVLFILLVIISRACLF
ncbi:MAG: hypothetical protein ACQEXQ_13730 [Bacillota bacterium]